MCELEGPLPLSRSGKPLMAGGREEGDEEHGEEGVGRRRANSVPINHKQFNLIQFIQLGDQGNDERNYYLSTPGQSPPPTGSDLHWSQKK